MSAPLSAATPRGPRNARPAPDLPFNATLVAICAVYAALIIALLAANASFTSWADLRDAWADPNIRYAARLSLLTSTATALLSVLFAVPIGYLLARHRFPGRALLEAVLDIPIVLPPLVVGLSLLILFNQTALGVWFEEHVARITYRVPSVIVAQFAVAAAFAVRTMVVTFEQIDPRPEQVAWTLGCSRVRAFGSVVLPQARRGAVTAGLLAWARALGEFGPVLVFSGTTRMRTEVLPSSIFLELSVGSLAKAVAVSFLLVTVALLVLIAVRGLGSRRTLEVDP